MSGIAPPWAGLGVALGIGLMLGLERERSKGTGRDRSSAGVRTFALVSLLGGLCVTLGNAAVLVLAGAFVGAAAIVAYAVGDREDPGLTTEIALFTAFVLGAFALSQAQIAVAIAVAVTTLLALRAPLHLMARQLLSDREVLDGLLLAVCALIVWPLVPNRALGPYDAINPFRVWRLVVVVMALGVAGYAALRALGPRLGLALSGFASGFVSSTATIAAMGARARREPTLFKSAVAGAVLSNAATIVQLAIVLAIASSAVLARLALPIALAGATQVVHGLIAGMRSARATPSGAAPGPARAVDLRTALLFALIVVAATFVGAALHATLGTGGLWLAAIASGLADAHAAATSVATLAATGRITAEGAAVPVLLALSANAAVKLVVAVVAGGRRFAVEVGAGVLATVASAWIGWFIAR